MLRINLKLTSKFSTLMGTCQTGFNSVV